MATAPRVFTAFTKPILFLFLHNGFHIVIYLDGILVLVHSKQAGARGHDQFCVLYWFALDYILFFQSLTFASLSLICFLGLCWDTVNMSVSLQPDKLAGIQQLALSMLQTQPVAVHQVMLLFRQGQILCQWPLTSAAIVSCHS